VACARESEFAWREARIIMATQAWQSLPGPIMNTFSGYNILSWVVNFYSLLYFLTNQITSRHRASRAVTRQFSLSRYSLYFLRNLRVNYRNHQNPDIGPNSETIRTSSHVYCFRHPPLKPTFRVSFQLLTYR
jgi:hypothetical protein